MKAVPTITYVNNAYDDIFLRVARVFGKTYEKNGLQVGQMSISIEIL